MRRASKESARTPSMIRGEHIRDVAIVATFSQEESFRHAMSYVNEWRKRGMRSVDLYLYFPNRKMIEEFSGSTKDFPFCRSDFNFAGKAKTPDLIAGIRKPYDVLIDLSRGKALPCDLVVSKIQAKWKSGEHDLQRAYLLDLMIDVKQDPDIRKLIHHIDHYLFNLNTSNAA